ncbi:MAG: hypothetical protein LBP59_12410 [Planctomycetaceae bacterium]|jgi:transcriptional regulator with XRE-family HTH domain|nr:hypothetical protein [Planctomycetaceae bacterium]
MNHPAPSFTLPVPATITQAITPVTLIAATVNIVQTPEQPDVLSGNIADEIVETIISQERISNGVNENNIDVVDVVDNIDDVGDVVSVSNVDNIDDVELENIEIDRGQDEPNDIVNIANNITGNIVVDVFDGVEKNNVEDNTIIVTENISNNGDGKNTPDKKTDDILDVNSAAVNSDNINDNINSVSVDSVKVNSVGFGGRSRFGLRRELHQAVKLHRLAEVRVDRGLSLSSVAKRLRITIAEAREQEDAATDLRLSQLYRWRDILDVSVGELIVEPEEIPVNPVKNRCQLVRLMKTVRSIIIEAKSDVILIFARQLESQLIELMPELATIAAWPSLGQSRDAHAPGAAVTRCIGFGNVYQRKTSTIKSEQ